MVPIVDTLTGISMATVVVVGGQMVLNGGARRRRHGRVPVLHPALLRPDPLAHHAVFGACSAPWPRASASPKCSTCPVDIDDKPDAVALTARHGRLGRVQERHLRLPPEPAGAEERAASRSSRARPSRWSAPPARARPSSMALVHRFYDVWDGAVLVGGHDVRDVTQESLGRAGRHGAAGAVPVHRHRHREHPLPQDRRTARAR